jgi:hypothetical protein
MDDKDFDAELLRRDAMNRATDTMEVKTGFGSLKASGSVVVIIIAIAAGVAVTAYLIHDEGMRNVDRAADMRASQREIVSGQRQVVESLDANTYVLTLTEAERRALKMDMPESLRRKVRQ